MKQKIILLFAFLAVVSCKKEQSKNIIDENFCREQLEIIIDESRIIVDFENNNAQVKTEKIIHNKPTIESRSFQITEAEKQKLFSNAYNLITLKEYTIHTKTCNAGQNFTLKLICDTKSLEFHHSSVANWSKISQETMEIYSILKAKVNLKE